MRENYNVLVEVVKDGYNVYLGGIKKYKFGEMICQTFNSDISYLKDYIMQSKYLMMNYDHEQSFEMFQDFQDYIRDKYDPMTFIQHTIGIIENLSPNNFSFAFMLDEMKQNSYELLVDTPYDKLGNETLGQQFLTLLYLHLDGFNFYKDVFIEFVNKQNESQRLPDELLVAFDYSFGSSVFQKMRAFVTTIDTKPKMVYEVTNLMDLVVFEVYHCILNDIKFGYNSEAGHYYILSKKELKRGKH